MAATISSISPVSGAPGTIITVTGSGFDAVAQVGCPALVDTTFVNSTTLKATVPAELVGPEGGQMAIVVFVQSADASLSNVMQFTVLFPSAALQSWTTIDRVCAEIPGFNRGGSNIPDTTIDGWMISIAQSVSGCLLRRGLPLDPTQWPQAVSGSPAPQAVLEQVTRYGAAARLAAAVSAQFSGGGEWGLAKDLAASFKTEFNLLSNGAYDKLFSPTAATVDSGQQVDAGGIGLTSGGWSGQAFRKDQVF